MSLSISTTQDRQEMAESLRTAMRWVLAGYILLFPLGMSLREIGVGTCLICLAGIYVLDFENTNLRRYHLGWALGLFLAVLTVKTMHTLSLPASWYAFKHNIYKGPVLFLVGLEAVRSSREFKPLAWAFILMTVYSGLDGMYQIANGEDFFFGMPASGRVNAMWETGRIGNLMALCLPMLLLGGRLLPHHWPAWLRWTVVLVLALPGLYLWFGARARSGWFGLGVGLAGLFYLRWGLRKGLALTVAVVVLFLFFGPTGLSLHELMGAPRLNIWETALEVFKASPFLGAGVNCFEPGYKALGIAFNEIVFDPPVPHPHCIYLQFLAETGIIGTLGILTFLFGTLGHSFMKIRHWQPARWPDSRLFAACLWASHLGYLVTGLSAHNFFRTWWLAMAMLIMGLGAAMVLSEGEDS